MFSSIALTALFWGVVSAVSLPLGATIGLWTRPSRKVTSGLMAFGGGALLFALSIELFGHVLHVAGDAHGHIVRPGLVLTAIAAAIVGGLLFNGLNMLLEGQGGFLRRRVLIRRQVARRMRSDARRMLRSLAKVDYFRHLPPEEVIRLIPDVEKVQFPAGATIFRQGDEGDGLYIIDHGQVRVERPTANTPEQLATLGSGEILGEMALIADRPRSATATATAATRAWRIPKDDFLRHLDDSERLRKALHGVVSKRVQQDSQRETHEDEEEAMSWSIEAQESLENRLPRELSLEERQEAAKVHGNPALAIWLGIGLDAIPESLVIGMLVVQAAAAGTTLSLAFIAGVFLANLPEAMSSSVTMKDNGLSAARIHLMWGSLCALTGLGALVGALMLPPHPEGVTLYFVFAMEGLASGAMLTMIAQIMLPEAFEQGGGPIVGLATLGGFLAALAVKLGY